MSADPTTPQRPTSVTDPYGSGSTFTWSAGGVDHIPQAGDPDFVQYNQALGKWLIQRQLAYQQTQQYQADQAKSNPAIARGEIPAIGFTPEGSNAWNIPVGARVTSLTPTEGGGYKVGYVERGEPQRVSITGPGYAAEGTVYAPTADAAGKMFMASYRNQTAGIETGPRQIGGEITNVIGGHAVIQAGDPVRNEFWVKEGLPQYAGFEVPALSAKEQSEGFYIKDVKANGVSPSVTVGNKVWENFWTTQGYPQFGNYQAPTLESGQYVFDAATDQSGKLSYKVGNKTWESQWQSIGVSDVNLVRGYQPPTLEAGQYVYNPSVDSNGQLSFGVGNKIWESQWQQLGVTDISLIRGYQPPSLEQGNYVFNPNLNTEGKLSYSVGNTAWESQWQALGVKDIDLIRGYQPPTGDLAAGSYVKDISKTSEGGLSYRLSTADLDRQLEQLQADAPKWASAGYNQYAGQYLFPELPEGASIESVSPSETGLNVSYRLPSSTAELGAENYDAGYSAQLASMRNAFSVYNGVVNSPSRVMDIPVSSPYSTAEILEQNLGFSQAFVKGLEHPELIGVPGSGAISLQQYNAAMAVQQMNYLAATGGGGKVTVPKVSVPVNVFPSDPTDTVYIGGKGGADIFLRSDYKIASKTVDGLQSTYTFAPVNQPALNIVQPPTPNIAGFSFGNGISGVELDLGGLFGSQPIVNTSAKRSMALEALTIVVAPTVGGSQLLIGEGIGAGLAQVPNVVKYAQGQPVTVMDITRAGLEGGASGAILTGVGGKIINVAGLAGKGAVPALGRVAINTGLSAGAGVIVEQATTGRITVENVAVSAGFGAAFGSVGELGSISKAAMVNSKGGKILQEQLNASYLSAETYWKPSLSEKIVMRTTGLTPNKPASFVAAGTDVNSRLLDAGFVKPPEAPMTAGERLVAQRALGIKEPIVASEELAFKNPTAETIESLQATGPDGYVRMPVEKEALLRTALGIKGQDPMPPDYLKSFGITEKHTFAPQLNAEETAIANMHLKATSNMPKDYAVGFGTEKTWDTPSRNVSPLKASELPNPVSKTLTDMVWDLSTQPGTSSFAVGKDLGTFSGKESKQSFSGNVGLGLASQTKNVQEGLKEITQEVRPTTTQQNVANTPTLTAIKTSTPTRINEGGLFPIMAEEATAEKTETKNPFLESTSPYPISKKKTTAEEMLFVYSVPTNSPVGSVNEEQLILPMPSQASPFIPVQPVALVPFAQSERRERVKNMIYNVAAQVPFSSGMQGVNPILDLNAKAGFTPASAVTPSSMADVSAKFMVAPALDTSLVQDVGQATKFTLRQTPRYGLPEPNMPRSQLGFVNPPSEDFNFSMPKVTRPNRNPFGSMKRRYPIAEPSVLVKKPKISAPFTQRRRKK